MCGFVGCSPPAPDPALERSFHELERMAFVPAGQVQRQPGPSRAQAIGAVETDLLVDRYEVSRADWLHWGGSPTPGDTFQSELTADGPGRDAWPAFASFDEAEDLARRRGMRLPRVREWVFLASSGQARGYPWGVLPRASVANTLDLGLRRPLPVGTFESGTSTTGLYDLIGNVAEWAVPDGAPVGFDPESARLPAEGEAASLGGSFVHRLRPVVLGEGGAALAVGEIFGRGTSGPDLGFRCVVEAREFVERHAAGWLELPDAVERLERVGAAWGPSAVAGLVSMGASFEAESAARTVSDAILTGARR